MRLDGHHRKISAEAVIPTDGRPGKTRLKLLTLEFFAWEPAVPLN